MLCNVCGKNESTIHLTEIVNSQMVEMHLCEGCAQEKGNEIKPQLSLNDLLSDLSDISGLVGGQKKEALECRACGLTYEEFGKTGRLGCPDCYDAFIKPLFLLVKRIQKDTQHVGKRPAKAPRESNSRVNMRDLQERLRKSIQMEEFEEAARIRDQIKQLESKIKKGGGTDV